MKTLYALLIVIISSFPLSAVSTEISIGSANSWEGIEVWENTTLYNGPDGLPVMGLETSEYDANSRTDLLIHFNKNGISDSTGNYQIETSAAVTDKNKMHGDASGVFRGEESALKLYPKKRTIFDRGKLLDSFSIEFWLNSSRYSNNSVIFLYQSVKKNSTGNLQPQELICSLKDRKIIWEFTNIFFSDTPENRLELKGITSAIPGTWHHHLLRFDGNTGLIEYLVDGIVEAVAYTTKTGSEDPSITYPLMTMSADPTLIIGREFTGFMDEFRISEEFITDPVRTVYSRREGRVVTDIIDLGRFDSRLEKISAVYRIPDDSNIDFSYSLSDNLMDLYDDINWKQVVPGETLISDNRGRYLRIRLDIQPDGMENETPLVSDISVLYTENLPPIAPAFISAEAAEGEVTLSWPRMVEPDIRGFIVYYGTESGVYFGTGSSLGASPVVLPDKTLTGVTLKGLKNGTLYHFAVAAYDGAGPDYPGDFSREITSRPSAAGDN